MSIDDEHHALREGAGLRERPAAALEMTGEDRLRFLNGLVTCDVKPLEPGEGAYGFVTQVKGRVLADVTVLAHGESLWLVLPPGQGEEIAAHLSKYAIVDRVEIRPLTGWRPLALAGPATRELLAGVDLPAATLDHCEAEVLGTAVRVVREADLGVPVWTLWSPEDEAVALHERLVEKGARAVGDDAWERLRVEAGRALFGQDFGPDNFPQETGLEDVAVSYTKGCYLGQEVVARIHYRGGVNRHLRGLRFDGVAEPRGQEAVLEGRAAGTVTSAVHSPVHGHIGLAVLHRRVEPGARVEVGEGTAEVVELPFG